MMIKAFIPARGGSKSIPNKNIVDLAGKPLIQWVIDSANKSEFIDEIIVSTDSDKIANKIKNAKIFKRSAETATDTASSEMALIEFVKTCKEDDLIIFLQATSPLISHQEIDLGITKVINENYDSALSVVRMKRFIWDPVHGANYELNNRPRRQDYDGILIENGAFYISKAKDILRTGLRISGKIAQVECDEKSFIEIDEPLDLILCGELIQYYKLNN